MNPLQALPLLLAIVASTTACYLGPETERGAAPTPAAAPLAAMEVDYEPEYYDDYVVYFDSGGLPYYYVDGRIRLVSRNDVLFGRYVNHYKQQRDSIRRWEAEARRRHIERREHVQRHRAGRPHR